MDINETIHVICDEINVNNRLHIKLIDVYDCDIWRSIVIDSKCDHLYLVSLTYDEFLSLTNAEVLSYRWSEVIKMSCRVYAPGEQSNPSEIRTFEIALDIFRKLKQLNNSFLWIDYLSHLNNEQHKRAVISRMGSLYLRGLVYPLYLHDYKCDHDNSNTDMLSLSLRRGWIQQEISFGRLNRDVVCDFVKSSLLKNDYGNLGTLIRRRACAIKWSFEKIQSLENVPGNICNPDICPEQIKKFNKGIYESRVHFILGLFRLSPLGRTNSNVYECISFLVNKENENSFTEELTDVLCRRNVFDPRDTFCAQSLLRSFAESRLTYETDAYIAMTQIPALSCGITTVDEIKDPYMTVLRLCWLSILESDEYFEFSINRELESDWTLGLHELLPYIQDAVKENHNLIINIGSLSSCRKIIYSLKIKEDATRVPELYVTSSALDIA